MGKGQKTESPVNIARYLSGIDFPVDKQDLVEHARQKKADQEVLDILEQMPDKEYASMKDVMKGVGEIE